MSVIRIAHRYAKSLLEFAHEENALDAVYADAQSFMKVLENKEFRRMLKSPIIKADKKEAIYDAIFGGKFHKITDGFFKIIMRKHRENLLEEIVKEFIVEYKAFNHISVVKLITATPISEETIEAIKAQLLASDKTDEKIELTTKVDPELMGGFVLEFNNQLYDASLAHKLDKLKREFNQNLYIKNF
ncbi:MAG: ATP synthase F1 subunit delta [Bacteroidota bacterium]